MESLLGEIPKSEEETKIEIIEFDLFENLSPIYEIFKTIIYFLKEGYTIDTNLLLRLIDENKLNLKESLDQIIYLHSGFLEIALEELD